MFNVMCEDYNGVIAIMGTYATEAEAEAACWDMSCMYDPNGASYWYVEQA